MEHYRTKKVSLASQLSSENRVFCTNRVKSQIVFKNFSIFPRITCTHLVFSASPSPKTSIFSINLQEKVWVFLLFSMYFKFLVLVFLDFVYMLRYGNMVVEYGFVDVLPSMIFGFCWFCWYNAYSICFTCLFFILMHHTMLCVVGAYYIHDKMSFRCFCTSLWIPLSTKIVRIIMFPWFWNIKWLFVFFLHFAKEDTLRLKLVGARNLEEFGGSIAICVSQLYSLMDHFTARRMVERFFADFGFSLISSVFYLITCAGVIFVIFLTLTLYL